MSILKCRRCDQDKESLESPPFGGSLGETIHSSVCAECWSTWVGEQTKIINEYRLSMGNPQSHEILERQMKAFLNL